MQAPNATASARAWRPQLLEKPWQVAAELLDVRYGAPGASSERPQSES